MKTRKILAASTAALLAFGTTAAYVASATTPVEADYAVTVTAKKGATLKATTDAKEIEGLVDVDVELADKVTSPTLALDKVTATVKELAVKSGTTYNATVELADKDTPADKIEVTVEVEAAPADEDKKDEDTSKPETSKPSEAPTFDADDIEDDGTVIGAGVTASVSESAAAKLPEDFSIKASSVIIGKGEKNKDGDFLVDTDSDVVKKLSKSLKKEIAKVKWDEFEVVDIDVADGKYAESSTPVAITFTVEMGFDANVYHVSGESVELLKSKSRKLSNGNYEITFSTKTFSPFIFTSAELKNAKATNKDNEPTDSAATSDGSTSTNPDTGIALAIAPVVLAAGAVAVVALKKKH